MKVLEVSSNENLKAFCDYTLQKSIVNDYLFDNFNYKIVIKLEDMTDFLYRLLWETTYMRYTDGTKYDIKNDLIYMKLSLSEALTFIKQNTPPILQKYIPESIKSVDSIKEILQQFLIDDYSGVLSYYLSRFKQHTKLCHFDTIMNYDKSRIKMLRQYFKINGVISDILVYNKPINDIINGSLDPSETDTKMHIMFHTKNRKDLKEFLLTIDEIQRYEGLIKVININKDDEELFIETYIDGYNKKMIMFNNIIQKTYKVL